jgi:uncharacterized protein YbjT (DUF2867 family)
LSEAPEDGGLSPLQRKQRSRSEAAGDAAGDATDDATDGAADDAESGGAAAAVAAAAGKLPLLLSLLSLEPPCEPLAMFSWGVRGWAALRLGGVDPTTGLPATAFGRPIDPQLLKVRCPLPPPRRPSISLSL